MQKIDIGRAEAVAIDTACVNLMETVRRGRKKQEAYIQEDNDPDGAASLEDGISGLEQARITLRRLLERAGWPDSLVSQAYKENGEP